MQNKELILNLIEMLISGDETKKASSSEIHKGQYIVIGNRGNIVVGDLTISGDMCSMKNASVIRRWGTTNGLGQLALEGSTKDTILDPCGDFEFHILTTCGLIPVESDFGKRK